jgi:hypothetical protein
MCWGVHLFSSHPCIQPAFLLAACILLRDMKYSAPGDHWVLLACGQLLFYFRPVWVSVPFTYIFVKTSMCDVSSRPHKSQSDSRHHPLYRNTRCYVCALLFGKRHTTCVKHATSSSFCHLSQPDLFWFIGLLEENPRKRRSFSVGSDFKKSLFFLFFLRGKILFSIFLHTKNKAKP